MVTQEVILLELVTFDSLLLNHVGLPHVFDLAVYLKTSMQF